ncbi:MAG: hypothetical protein KKA28_12560, partial [Planctomycetes bacterium]|nr:hypothetical protein [Planctomycetota bacterium]
ATGICRSCSKRWTASFLKKDLTKTGRSRDNRSRNRLPLFNCQRDILLSVIEGRIAQQQGNKVKVDMSIRKNIVIPQLEQKQEITELDQRITGLLERRSCLAGLVQYHDPISGKVYSGDMILVDYASHLGGEQVEEWFQK